MQSRLGKRPSETHDDVLRNPPPRVSPPAGAPRSRRPHTTNRLPYVSPDFSANSIVTLVMADAERFRNKPSVPDFRNESQAHPKVRQPISGPSTEPADLPIAEAGTDRDRSGEAKEFRFERHRSSALTGASHDETFPLREILVSV